MGVITGIGGAVNGRSCVRKWQITSSADIQAFIASNTKGATGRTAGNTDWSGNYSAYGSTPGVLPGESFTFTGSIDGAKGAVGTALVESVDIECDIEGGGLLSHTVNFGGDGALALGAAVATDGSVLIPPSAIGCKAALGTLVTTPVWTDLADVRSWKLSLKTANQEYVSSSTSGGKRRKKGNLDASMSISLYTDDFSSLPAVNTVKAVRLYVSASTYWEILWGILGEASDMLVDPEAHAIVGATLNLEFTGLAEVGGAPTIGSIKTPAGSTYWPFS